MKLRALRQGDVLDDGNTVVVRGGQLDLEILRADASRYRSIYGVCGLSVFAVRGVTLDEMAQETPLVRFAQLTLIEVKDLWAAGLRLSRPGATFVTTR